MRDFCPTFSLRPKNSLWPLGLGLIAGTLAIFCLAAAPIGPFFKAALMPLSILAIGLEAWQLYKITHQFKQWALNHNGELLLTTQQGKLIVAKLLRFEPAQFGLLQLSAVNDQGEQFDIRLWPNQWSKAQRRDWQRLQNSLNLVTETV